MGGAHKNKLPFYFWAVRRGPKPRNNRTGKELLGRYAMLGGVINANFVVGYKVMIQRDNSAGRAFGVHRKNPSRGNKREGGTACHNDIRKTVNAVGSKLLEAATRESIRP